MIKETYVKEFDKENGMIAISFEGNAEDIRELRDYARIINAVHGEVEKEHYRGFNKNEEENDYNIECFLKKAYDELENSHKINLDKIDFDMFVKELTDEMFDIAENIVNNADVYCDEKQDNENELCDIVSDIMEEEAEDLVNHPSHYTNSGMECILEMVMLYGFEETMSFCKLNCHKYRKRALDKGGRMDMDKSNWYINTYKELSIALETGMTPLQYVLSKSN